MKFRPCIELHAGHEKQIIGSSITDMTEGGSSTHVTTNFTTTKPAPDCANIYARDNLLGGHVIMLDPNNEAAAMEAVTRRV